jgi:pimeloyl-ACP methyl ester carboxylesterase
MSHIDLGSGTELRYETAGDGVPVLAIHGAYSAHEEIRGFLDGMIPGYRRIYPDLPGMGESTASAIRNAADVVTAIEALVDAEVGPEPFAVVGHSFGAHIARGLAARRPDQVLGLALVCPMVPDRLTAEPHVVVADDRSAASLLSAGELEEFRGYFVVQTAATVARFRDAVAPVLGRYDGGVTQRLLEDWTLDPAPADAPFSKPVLVLTGRHDSFVGYRQHLALLEEYPEATSMVVAGAGHALPHEQPELVAAAIRHWLARIDAAT